MRTTTSQYWTLNSNSSQLKDKILPLLSLDWKGHDALERRMTVQNNFAFKAERSGLTGFLCWLKLGLGLSWLTESGPQRAQPLQSFLQSNKLALFYLERGGRKGGERRERMRGGFTGSEWMIFPWVVMTSRLAPGLPALVYAGAGAGDVIISAKSVRAAAFVLFDLSRLVSRPPLGGSDWSEPGRGAGPHRKWGLQ